jgi:hypothetical protein
MKVPTGNLQGLTSNITGINGPWLCEKCGHLTQYADVRREVNIIFCSYHRCDFRRTIDKRHHRIIEDDGSVWHFDPTSGAKERIRAQ